MNKKEKMNNIEKSKKMERKHLIFNSVEKGEKGCIFSMTLTSVTSETVGDHSS